MKEKVKIASTYIRDLEKGFQEASIPGYSSIYEIYEPEFLEKPKIIKVLKETPTLRCTPKLDNPVKGFFLEIMSCK